MSKYFICSKICCNTKMYLTINYPDCVDLNVILHFRLGIVLTSMLYYTSGWVLLYNTVTAVLEMKIWIYWSKSNSWIYFIYMYIKIKTENFTGPNKVWLVLGRRTGVHHEDCCALYTWPLYPYHKFMYCSNLYAIFVAWIWKLHSNKIIKNQICCNIYIVCFFQKCLYR
jgi:hypothetical protein